MQPNPPCILVLARDPTIHNLFARYAAHLPGLRVLMAFDGVSSVRLAKDHAAQLLLVALEVSAANATPAEEALPPHLVVAGIRTAAPKIPVLPCVAADADPAQLAALGCLGCDTSLHTPIDDAQLVDAVATLISSRLMGKPEPLPNTGVIRLLQQQIQAFVQTQPSQPVHVGVLPPGMCLIPATDVQQTLTQLEAHAHRCRGRELVNIERRLRKVLPKT